MVEPMIREKMGELIRTPMQLLSLLARSFGMCETPLPPRRTVGSNFKAAASAGCQARAADAEELFERRFQQLVVGGWSFRAATAVAFVEATINSTPSGWLPGASAECP
jgi:hypothetical protein